VGGGCGRFAATVAAAAGGQVPAAATGALPGVARSDGPEGYVAVVGAEPPALPRRPSVRPAPLGGQIRRGRDQAELMPHPAAAIHQVHLVPMAADGVPNAQLLGARL